MPRDLTTATAAAIAAERGGFIHLIEVDSSSGALRLATAAQDIAWDGETWTGAGGVLDIGAVQEVGDADSPGVDLTLSGVDQAIIADLLGAHVRGRVATLWRARLGADGSVVADPVKDMLFTGYLNSDWSIEETRDERSAVGTVTIKTQVVARGALLQQTRVLTSAPDSLNAMLARLDLSPSAVGDTFFATVASITGRTIYWGTHRGGVLAPNVPIGHPGSQS
jgi:hypothetical protein